MLSSRFWSSAQESSEGSAVCTCKSIGCSDRNLVQSRWPMYGVSPASAKSPLPSGPAFATVSTTTDLIFS